MSRTQRFGLLALAAAIAVAATVVVATGDEDRETTRTPLATAPSAPEPPQPVVPQVRLRDHEPVGGVEEIVAAKGDTTRFMVISDAADEIHLHGYDMTLDVAPGKPARFVVKTTIEGIFEIESHEAEHVRKDPLVARLRVEP